MSTNHFGRYIKVRELERKIKALEGIEILIDAPNYKLVPDYGYSTKIPNRARVYQFFKWRMSLVVLRSFKVTIKRGDGEEVTHFTSIGTIRGSYK